VRGNLQLERAPHWDKIILINRALTMGFELVIWLDADTLIVRPEEDWRAALPDGPPIGMCKHPTPFGNQPWHYNSGVMFIRNTDMSREFFKSVWKTGPVNHPWQEQIGINELSQQIPGSVQTLHDRWNSTVELTPTPDPVILAWHGWGLGCLAPMQAALQAASVRAGVTAGK